ncbi:hypothetical protein D9M69_680620 [compost metagenome]
MKLCGKLLPQVFHIRSGVTLPVRYFKASAEVEEPEMTKVHRHFKHDLSRLYKRLSVFNIGARMLVQPHHIQIIAVHQPEDLRLLFYRNTEL